MKSEKKKHALMFHRFHKNRSKKVQQGSLSEKNFEKIIHKIGRKNILNPKEWLKKYEDKKLKNHQVCFTFDDGLKSQIKVAVPIMNKYKIKAFFFIHSLALRNKIDFKELASYMVARNFKNHNHFVKEFIKFLKLDEQFFSKNRNYLKYFKKTKKLYPFYSVLDIKYRYLRNNYLFSEINSILKKFFKIKNSKQIIDKIWLNKKEISQLSKDGHFIGLHSNDHSADIVRKTKLQQLINYKKNLNSLKKISKMKIFTMSHPLGAYTSVTLDCLSSLGINYGFCANMNERKFNDKKYQNLTIPRKDTNFIIKKK